MPYQMSSKNSYQICIPVVEMKKLRYEVTFPQSHSSCVEKPNVVPELLVVLPNNPVLLSQSSAIPLIDSGK